MISPSVRVASRFSIPNIPIRRATSRASRWKPLQELRDHSLDTFRREAFAPSKPALLPRGSFSGFPACQKWFIWPQAQHSSLSLNHTYLASYGDAIVPLEFTRVGTGTSAEEVQGSFQRAEAPFQIFLEWTKHATMETPERLYLAQASLANFPQAMVTDIPSPEVVTQAGTGDIYDTNIWMGIAPTYTPLHRDPNPNLFVQLAGHKVVRMLPPEVGDKIFARVQSNMGKSGSAPFRGEDMMKGKEKRLLESEVWDDTPQQADIRDEGYEVHVWGGDGLFIPKGWWHSIKGVDGGILGSVNCK